jgi:membrane-associated phospholipid phosphatase
MTCPLWPICALKQRKIQIMLLSGLIIAISLMMDLWVYEQFIGYRSSQHDWQNVLKNCGYMPVWIVVGIVLILLNRHRPTGHLKRHVGTHLPAGLILIINVASCALVAEILKLIVRRERPSMHDGMYVYRSIFHKTFNSGGLGMPSSHTMVAFAAAWMFAKLYPRISWLCIAIAAGCGMMRVGSNAHFFSDAVVSMVVSYHMTHWIWEKCQRKRVCALEHAVMEMR